jgi:hypothetical protein
VHSTYQRHMAQAEIKIMLRWQNRAMLTSCLVWKMRALEQRRLALLKMNAVWIWCLFSLSVSPLTELFSSKDALNLANC